MTLELTEPQRQAVLNGEPVRLSDPQLGRDVFVVPADVFEEMRDILEDERQQSVFRAFARKQAAKLAKENPY